MPGRRYTRRGDLKILACFPITVSGDFASMTRRLMIAGVAVLLRACSWRSVPDAVADQIFHRQRSRLDAGFAGRAGRACAPALTNSLSGLEKDLGRPDILWSARIRRLLKEATMISRRVAPWPESSFP